MLFMAAMYLSRPVQQSIPKNRGARMTQPPNKIKLFEKSKSAPSGWWFSTVDIIAIFTEQKDDLIARKYWNKLKERLKKRGKYA